MYYTKNLTFLDCQVSTTTTCHFKKIFKGRDLVTSQNSCDCVMDKHAFSFTKLVYNMLLSDHVKVEWRHLMRGYLATPKVKFTAWLTVQINH